ncbi:MAG: hypothetical protein HKM92_11720 [Arenibacter sp.]|nr:hypothetical protein [Arenibacter sp.]
MQRLPPGLFSGLTLKSSWSKSGKPDLSGPTWFSYEVSNLQVPKVTESCKVSKTTIPARFPKPPFLQGFQNLVGIRQRPNRSEKRTL